MRKRIMAIAFAMWFVWMNLGVLIEHPAIMATNPTSYFIAVNIYVVVGASLTIGAVTGLSKWWNWIHHMNRVTQIEHNISKEGI